jgi:uncharacterized protein YjbI with pentapeptide repeats
VVLLLLLLAMALPAPAVAVEGTASRIPAGDIVDLILAEQPVDLDGVTVVGDLDLAAVDTVHRVFRCTNCAFEGAIAAANVIFERVVDFSGSSVAGEVDFQGAVFRDTYLMRQTPVRAAAVTGPTSFSLAAFHGRANFEGAQFLAEADFRVAQFLGDASFAAVDFGQDARFDSAIFAGRAQFTGSASQGGSFGGAAFFESVSFQGKADFRQRSFAGPATFGGSTFDTVDFTLAAFHDSATFDDASIEGAASFRVAQFYGGLSFQQVVLRGPADFEAALVFGEAEFHRTSAADRMSLHAIDPPTVLGLDQVRAADFQMDLELLDAIPSDGVRKDVLAMIASSARARGDIGLANDATFRRSRLETAQLTGVDRVLGLAGEFIGGYLVQPVYPLRALLLLVVVGAAVRTVAHLAPAVARRRSWWDLDSPAPDSTVARPDREEPGAVVKDPAARTDRRQEQLLRLSKALAISLRSVADTLRAAFRLKPRDVPARRREDLSAYGAVFLQGLEWLAFKTLIGLFLVCLANSNPTFKQLVEAVT